MFWLFYRYHTMDKYLWILNFNFPPGRALGTTVRPPTIILLVRHVVVVFDIESLALIVSHF